MNLEQFFGALWEDFKSISPAAADINTALVKSGERVLNDHVAFRTFDRGPATLDTLEPHLLALGYVRKEPYHFEQKKLRAYGYVHPTNAEAPKVFVSELMTKEFSPELQAIVDELVAQVPSDFASEPSCFWAGRPWAPVSYETYEALAAESEYAGWMAAMGYHANHFTIFVNELSDKFDSVADVLSWVESLGFGINASGGRIKGGPAVLLEQGSTLADTMPVEFSNGKQVIPTCYYEFAKRYAGPDGQLYDGFVAASADKIFESTDRQ